MSISKRVRLLPLIVMFTLSSIRAENADVGDLERRLEPAIVILKREVFPAVNLRGYGLVSGEFVLVKSGAAEASILVVHCESPDAARLLSAKYASDLEVLPGVQKIEIPVSKGKPGKIVARELKNFVVLAAGQRGSEVTILAAHDRDELAHLAGQIKGLDDAAWESTAAIPMYLDRWDRYGFRFYYREFEVPPGLKKPEEYDPMSEFDWARKNGPFGFIFWDGPYPLGGSMGMQEPFFNWGVGAAADRGLPVTINAQQGECLALINHFPEESQLLMPQFSGTYYRVAFSDVGGDGRISWAAPHAADAELAMIQNSLRRFTSLPNVITMLEPRGELKHGPHDILLEFGPIADASYRDWLKAKYKTLAVLSERWFLDAAKLKNWDDIHVPELASFFGWNTRAVDLQGEWKIQYESEGQRAPEERFAPEFDDSGWGAVNAPGSDRAMYLPKKPAVYRRHIHLEPNWRAGNKQAWLYLWDMNGFLGKGRQTGEQVLAFINGKKAGEDSIQHAFPHWAAWEVSALLKDGDNHMALRIPGGVIAYRTYLTTEAPANYPKLGDGKNAQWVDFADWTYHTRVDLVRRGMQMLRQLDPNKYITMFHPDDFVDDLKVLAEQFGGDMHNTGYMQAFFADLIPMLARSSNLPASVETGGPDPDLNSFKMTIGNYFSEGVNGVDYFIHVGSILFNAELKQHFEAHLPLLKLIGKYHCPAADVAVLYSDRSRRYTEWPWKPGGSADADLGGGYWNWNPAYDLLGEFERDGVTENDFAPGGAAGRYRVIIDSNTSIMTEEFAANIEAYVRNGGTFVTYVQTGRNLPTRPDAWPISRLTGYTVKALSLAANKSSGGQNRINPADGQEFLKPGAWSSAANADGLVLVKSAPECRDLALWNDGSVAIGMRTLGKGRVVHVGVHYDRLGDRYSDVPSRDLFFQLLDALGVPRIPAHTGPEPRLRHYISNNGLYDLWSVTTAREGGPKTPLTTDLEFAKGFEPAACIDADSQTPVELKRDAAGVRIPGITLAPLETKVFLTPSTLITSAPREWFALQRGWWQGTTPAGNATLPSLELPNILELTDEWRFKPLPENDDASAYTGAGPVDDAAWECRGLSVWAHAPGAEPLRHAVFRRRFTVPPTWVTGETNFWMQAWTGATFLDRGRIFLDGKLIRDCSGEQSIDGEALTAALQPGEHTLAVDIRSHRPLGGSCGRCWLQHIPAPLATLDLSGEWIPTRDGWHDDTAIPLPGNCEALLAKRTVAVGQEFAGKNVVVYIKADPRIVGVLINGRLVRRHHHRFGSETILNITPWVKFGAVNAIELAGWDHSEKWNVDRVELRFYALGSFP